MMPTSFFWSQKRRGARAGPLPASTMRARRRNARMPRYKRRTRGGEDRLAAYIAALLATVRAARVTGGHA